MKENEKLRKVQLLELEIAKELKRICKKNNIQYFLLAGSVLGAVRHKGFIPWDDDMDFGMLRTDYDIFVKVCEKDLDHRFFLQTWQTDPCYPFAYAKLRMQGTHFIEEFSKDSKIKDGIFIDIFPLDNEPKSFLLTKIRDSRCFVCERLMWLKKGMGKNIKSKSLGGKIKYIVFDLISKGISYNCLKKHYEKILRSYNSEKTEKIAFTLITSIFGKHSFERKWIEELEEIDFETTSFPVFKERKEYLTYVYGNYMIFPPEDKRQGHLPVDIDFGPYK